MSVGGMRDEAEIRGHRRTYIGSYQEKLFKWWKLVQKSLILLDEIDKVEMIMGDPSSALLGSRSGAKYNIQWSLSWSWLWLIRCYVCTTANT